MSIPKVQASKPLISFLLSKSVAEKSNAEAFIVPLTQKHKDFDYRIGCSIGFRNKDSHITWLEARCAIKGEKDLFYAVANLLGPNVVEIYALDMPRPFRTLLSDAKSYGIMRSALGETHAREILYSLRDIATVKSRPNNRDWVSFFEEDVFTHAMVRSSEAYFAYRRGERVLQGLQELDADALKHFCVELKGRDLKLYLNSNSTPITF